MLVILVRKSIIIKLIINYNFTNYPADLKIPIMVTVKVDNNLEIKLGIKKLDFLFDNYFLIFYFFFRKDIFN